jgi:octaprenyl-diphosphate synthase
MLQNAVGMDQVWSEHKTLLGEVEARIQRGLQSEVDLVNKVAQYIIDSGGKRIRPLLLIVSAHLCKGVDKNLINMGGSILEFIHTATLLHDDVIDNAEIRRGIPPARVLWGNQASILVGDYLYTLALSLAVKIDKYEANTLLSDTCLRMAEGEMLQLNHNNDRMLSEETYLKVIEYKTASLISTSCLFGAIIADATKEEKAALKSYGKNLGIAFQVADDTLDYMADDRLGKSLGEDLKEGKITLPLIHLLKHCQESERKWIDKLIGGKQFLPDDLKKVIDLMMDYGSIQYARRRAQEFSDSAKNDLDAFNGSRHRQSLIAVADYVVCRDH